MGEKLLEINDLTVHYVVDNVVIEALTDLSLDIGQGETVGLVGETGAGKTTTALSILGLIPDPPGRVINGQIYYQGQDLLTKTPKQLREIRGRAISMVFQDPMTSLNPVIPVGDQITEVILLHERMSKAEATVKAQQMLEMVGITASRYSEYPHQFSGGMKQRVVIACALACNPRLLIADEPTTALDVTIQAQVLELMRSLKKELDTAMLLITHDLGVVADICEQVAVMYAGNIVERGALRDIYQSPRHPYTRGLFESLPRLGLDADRLKPIPGSMPDPSNLPLGCAFSPRCPFSTAVCAAERPRPVTVSPGHTVVCFNPPARSA